MGTFLKLVTDFLAPTEGQRQLYGGALHLGVLKNIAKFTGKHL